MGNDQAKATARKTGAKKFLIIAGIIVVLFAGYALATRLNVSVTSQEAMDIAISFVGGGRASSPDLDFELWRWVWYVEVWHEGFVYEVYIHPNTGAVIRHEIDRD